MNSHQVLAVLDQIAAESSRSKKEEILNGAINPLMIKVIRQACDSFITYGIKPKNPEKLTPGVRTFDESTTSIWHLLDKLASREITGNHAKEEVHETFCRLDAISAQLLWRILSKDLRCGVTAKTINAVLPGTIPVFEVMLSKTYEQKRIKNWPVAVEPKMDGRRAMILVKNGQARAFSRVGNHMPSLDHLSSQIVKMIENAISMASSSPGLLAQAYVKMLGGDPSNPTLAIDCEAISNEDFYDGALSRKGEDAKDAVLHVFDALPYALLDRPEREINIPFKMRRRFLEFLILECAPKDAPVCTTPLRYANSHEEIMAFTEEHWEQGLEGSMVKELDSPYVKTKGHIWMKIKKEETLDLIVEDIFEGEGKYQDALGGFVVDLNGVKVRVGGGLTDEDRVLFWKNPSLIMGRMAEIEYHEQTPDGSLRHPRFKRWRDDKNEKLRVA